MTGSTEGQIDESSLSPGAAAYHPPLRVKTDRLGFKVRAGKRFSASIDAVVQGHGNSPVGFVLVIITAGGTAALAVVLCRYSQAPDWISLAAAGIAFAAVAVLGIRFISGKSRIHLTRPKRRHDGLRNRRGR